MVRSCCLASLFSPDVFIVMRSVHVGVAGQLLRCTLFCSVSAGVSKPLCLTDVCSAGGSVRVSKVKFERSYVSNKNFYKRQ